jgi:membrane dipeptidase
VIVDLHLDALLDVVEREDRGDSDVFARRHLPDLQAAGVRVQVLPVFIPEEFIPEAALRYAIRQLDAARREEDRLGGALRIVETASELRAALDAGAIAGILALEGAEPLGRDPGVLRTFHRLGVRMMGLTWNHANAFADGVGEPDGPGITARGMQLLAAMEDHGVALDLSHLSPRGCDVALERFGGAVLASHANARTVYDSPRNLGDETLQAVGERGGVVGLCAIPAFVGAGPFAQRLAAHHEHVTSLAGAQAPAFGADFCDFFGDIEGPILPDQPTDTDLELSGTPEPPRDGFYQQVLEAVGERPGGRLASANALRFLEAALG